jgi:hypothetical protein
MFSWGDTIARVAPSVLGASVGVLITWQFVERRLRVMERRLGEVKAGTAAGVSPDQPVAATSPRWEEVSRLSPELQTVWLSTRIKDWAQFVQDIQRSEAQLEAHRASGASGPPPGSLTLDQYRQKRALRAQAE